VKEVTVLRTVLIGIDPNQVLVLSFESKEKTRMKNTLNFFQPFNHCADNDQFFVIVFFCSAIFSQFQRNIKLVTFSARVDDLLY